MTAKGIPNQPNFSDCGLYLCAYMEKFILDPAGFVGKILQRQMEPDKDMPMMASEELRNRMRGMIIGLHHEQEGGKPESPLPEVGRILIAPPRAESPPDFSQAQTALQEDSEDELQQDQTNVGNIVKVARSPPPDHPQPMSQSAGHPAITAGSPEQSPAMTDAANSMADMLAKIDGESPSHSKTKPGTRETAITIHDDDEQAQPAPKSSPVKKKPIAKADFFEHLSELKDISSASKKSSSKRSEQKVKAPTIDAQPEERERRSGSRASNETVNTDFLSGGANKSYQHEPWEAQPAKREQGRHEIVVFVPDSQESVSSKEVGEQHRAEGRLRRRKAADAEDEPQEILEGVE
jgi:Ulp1 protease family, C-terminal catalytic domain